MKDAPPDGPDSGEREVRSFTDGAADVWLRRGQDAMDDPAEALRCFERAERLRPGHPDALLLAGRTLVELGYVDEGIERLRRVWAETRSPEAATHLARSVARHRDDPVEVESLATEVDAALADAPDDPALLAARGELLTFQDELEAAQGAFEAALAAAPGHPLARDGLALSLNREAFRRFERGETEQAIFLLKRAMDVAPDWVGLHVNLGRMFLALGRVARAREEFEHAAQGDPDDPIAWFNLGRLLREMGEYEASAAHLTRVLELDRDYPDGRPELAGVMHDVGRFSDAIDLLEEELRVDSTCTVCHHNLGLAYLEVSRLEQAEVCFRRAIDLDAGYFRAHYNLGATLIRQRRYDEALAMLERAGGIDPAVTREWLGLDADDFQPIAGDPRFKRLLEGP